MKTSFKIFSLALLFLVGNFCWGEEASAETYYVSADGDNYSWTTDSGGCGEPVAGEFDPCPIGMSNAFATAGDTVIFLDGVYTTSLGIRPFNSGTSESPITFQAESKSAILRTSSFGITIDTKDHIIIDGFTVDNATETATKWAFISSLDTGNAVGLEIKNCAFVANNYYGFAGLQLSGSMSDVSIHDNTFQGGVGDHPGISDCIYISTAASDDIIERVLIENNEIIGGSHGSIFVGAENSGTIRKIVVRGNTISNPNHSAIGFSLGGEELLIENNIIYDNGSICSLASCQENIYGGAVDRARPREQHGGISILAWDHAIVRNNIVSNSGYGIAFAVPPSFNHRVYNNVFHSNTRGVDINVPAPGAYDNYFVNNVWYQNTLEANWDDWEMLITSTGTTDFENYFINNIIKSDYLIHGVWGGSTIPPGVNATDSVEDWNTNSVLWSDNSSDISWLNLSSKYAIFDSTETGTLLTTAIGAGIDSNTLIVEDARYFHDTWGIEGLSEEQILINEVVADIASIDYESNTIILSSAKSWPDEAEIQLFQNTDKHVGLYYQLTVSNPSFTNGTGTYNNDISEIITPAVDGTTICYTTDGTDPAADVSGTCSNGSTYSTPIPITTTETVLKALGTKSGLTNSTIITATYTFTTANPTASLESESTIALSSETTGSTIRYAIDSAPTCSTGTVYSSPITISYSETIQAIACKDNYNDSEVVNCSCTEIADVELDDENEILDENKKFYLENDGPKLKGESLVIADGEVKIYKDGKKYATVSVDNEGKWSKTISFGHNRNYEIKIKFYDRFGTLVDTKEYKVKVDTEGPTFQDQERKITKNQTISFSADDEDSKMDYYKVKLLDNKGHILRSWKKQKQTTYSIPEKVKDQAKTIVVRAYDKAGNKTEQTFEVGTRSLASDVSGTQSLSSDESGTQSLSSDGLEQVEVQGVQTTKEEQTETEIETSASNELEEMTSVPMEIEQSTPEIVPAETKDSHWYNPFSWF